MPELAALPARFRGTHRLPPQGASLYTLPDATQQPIEQLAARAEVQVLQTWGSWSRVWTEQGRDGWVDGRLLRQL